MRSLFLLSITLFLTQATVSKADDRALDLEEADFAVSFETANAGNWNRWTCVAKKPFYIKLFRASSFYFRPQSGEGQTAKALAQKIALRACEFTTSGPCTSNLNECTVETF